LAKKGITIVSGMARGIDTVAHKAAIFAEGRTIGVLGSGIDVIYPSENSFLAGTISSQGAVITEFSPGTLPYAKNFLSRNRIISGLSIATLVVEGAARSGTLSISNWALNQGRDVFAIPGRIDSPLSALPNYLIENGAIPVTNPEDILDIIK
jgi:DNA processing protein